MKKRLAFLLIPAFLLQSCVNSGIPNDNKKSEPRPLTAAEQQIVSSSRAFSFEVFRHIVESDKSKNIFISPLSISMALGMTLNGAVGETKAGIKETLGMSQMELQAINQSYKSLIELLLTLDPNVTIGIGNSIWSRKGFPVLASFKDTLRKYFDARAEALNFSDPASADIINNWVEEQTRGRIDEIVKNIPSDLVLYLINAIYFKADWLYQFDPEETRLQEFHLEDGSAVKTEMMHQELPLAMFKSEEVKMANLAYGDSLFQMTILMPADPEIPINEFIANSLTEENMRQWTAQLKSVEGVKLSMPKFEVAYKIKLNDILKSMGMDEAFDERAADFSKISRQGKQLYVSTVSHKANITVNEEGTEAAAATKVGIGIISTGPIFKVNRPFVYLIRERTSGAILFMGAMRNPAN